MDRTTQTNEQKTVAFRPDEMEARLLRLLTRRHGLPKTRVLGIALREKAEREGIRIEVSDSESDGDLASGIRAASGNATGERTKGGTQ